jgi:hypothetical protein
MTLWKKKEPHKCELPPISGSWENKTRIFRCDVCGQYFINIVWSDQREGTQRYWSKNNNEAGSTLKSGEWDMVVDG